MLWLRNRKGMRRWIQCLLDKEWETKYFVWCKIAQSYTVSHTIDSFSRTVCLQTCFFATCQKHWYHAVAMKLRMLVGWHLHIHVQCLIKLWLNWRRVWNKSPKWLFISFSVFHSIWHFFLRLIRSPGLFIIVTNNYYQLTNLIISSDSLSFPFYFFTNFIKVCHFL